MEGLRGLEGLGVRQHSSLGKSTPAEFAALLREPGSLSTTNPGDKLATTDSTK